MSGICRVAPCRIQCVDHIAWVLLGFTMGSTVLILTFASGVDTIVHFVGEDILVLGGIPVHTEYRCLFFLRYEFLKYRNTGVI